MLQRLAFIRALRRRIAIVFLSVGALALLSAPARADDSITANTTPQIPGGPSVQFTGTEKGSWETNPLMLFTGAKELYGSITSPEVTFNGKTPTSMLSVDTLVNENLFNLSTFDSTDLHEKTNFTDQMQRWGLQVQQTVDYDTTRTSELFPTAFNGQLSSVPVRHLGLSLGPQIAYSPDATDKVALATSVVDSQYDNPIFTNYVQAIITPSYSHDFDPLNTGTFSLQAQRYQTTSGPKVYDDTIGPQIGWIGKLTPRFTAQVSAGIQEARQFGSGAVQEPWSLQYTFSSDLGFKGEQDTTHFIASRNDYPFGNGTDTLLTTFSVTESHALNQRLSLNAGASYQSATYQSLSPGSLDKLITGTGGLTYHATERLDIAATYQYKRETLMSTSGNAQDNMVTLGLTWHPQAWGL